MVGDPGGESNSRFALQPFEPRRLMSAGLFADWPARVWDEMPAAHAAPPPPPIAASVMPAAAKPKASSIPQVVGTWSGTCKVATTGSTVAISMKITSQNGAAALGSFSLGPITANQTVISTAIVDGTNARGFNAIFAGKKFYGSVTATVSKNGQQILGRWTCISAGMKTGTFVLNMQ